MVSTATFSRAAGVCVALVTVGLIAHETRAQKRNLKPARTKSGVQLRTTTGVAKSIKQLAPPKTRKPAARALSSTDRALLLSAHTAALSAPKVFLPTQPRLSNQEYVAIHDANIVSPFWVWMGSSGFVTVRFLALKGYKYLIECGVYMGKKSATSNFGIKTKKGNEQFTTSVKPGIPSLVVGTHNHSNKPNYSETVYLVNTSNRTWTWQGCTITPAKVN